VNQLQTWISSAAAWIGENSTDVVYIGLAAAVLVLLGSGGGRR
jgi:hypothetical protein